MANNRKRLRFFAHQLPDGQWVAHCIDFSLAAQAASFEEVKANLHSQVVDYCEYINSQQHDPEFQQQLLNRKAPFETRLQYAFAVFVNQLSTLRSILGSKRHSWQEVGTPLRC